MKKLSDVHSEIETGLIEAAKLQGYKVNETSADGAFAEFTVKMNRTGQNAEMKVETNGKVLYYGAGSIKDMTSAYAAIMEAIRENILPFAAGTL